MAVENASTTTTTTTTTSTSQLQLQEERHGLSFQELFPHIEETRTADIEHTAFFNVPIYPQGEVCWKKYAVSIHGVLIHPYTLYDENVVNIQGFERCVYEYVINIQVLKVEILSTWGDPHYVGLSGIEIFDERGSLVRILEPKEQVGG